MCVGSSYWESEAQDSAAAVSCLTLGLWTLLSSPVKRHFGLRFLAVLGLLKDRAGGGAVGQSVESWRVFVSKVRKLVAAEAFPRLWLVEGVWVRSLGRGVQ